MERSLGRRTSVRRGACRILADCWRGLRLTLAGCNPDKPGRVRAQPRGATVAFDSLDGLPPGQFQQLVQNLNDEAQSRRLAVISREQPSAYRVRGYLAAKVTKHQTIVSWVWDVFDQDEHRALRISGEENAKIRHSDAWAAADDAMLHRIAHISMDQLAAFLTSPRSRPARRHRPRKRRSRQSDAQQSSPEAAGIFRISRPQADPISTTARARRRRRPAAIAAPPTSGCCLVGRDADAGGIKPLTANSSCRRKLRTIDLQPYCRALPALL